MLKAKKKKKKPAKNVHVCSHTCTFTQKTQLHMAVRRHTHKCMPPMRQMRSERSHIKQPNLSCFAFIAPVHFHNALKPQLRRQEWKKMRRGVEGDRERNGKEGGQETFSK